MKNVTGPTSHDRPRATFLLLLVIVKICSSLLG